MSIHELVPGSVGANIEELLAPGLPTRPRAIGVLDGSIAGRAWADRADAASWVIVVETADGTVFGGGALTTELLTEVLHGLRTLSGDLIFGYADADDPMRAVVPRDPYFAGRAIDFTDREPDAMDGAAQSAVIPDGLELAEIDQALLPRIEWSDDTLHTFGSAERWIELGVGRALLAEGAVVAQAQAGPRVRGLLEMGVVTRTDHRGRGLGTLLSRLVAEACEARGDRVWWNASAENVASQSIARRLGFRHERIYDLVAYRTDAWPSP